MSATSAKGKERATPALDSDSDDDLSYFTLSVPAPKRRRARPLTPPRPRAPSPDRHTAESSGSERELCASERLAQTRRPKYKSTPGRTTGRPPRIQARVVAQKEANVAHVGHVEPIKPVKEEDAVTRMKRELAEAFKAPDLSEEQEHFIRQTVAIHCAELMGGDEDPLPSEAGLDTPSRPDRSNAAAPRLDESVNIIVKMVADPARREAGHSERAIARYEKKRAFKVNRRDPFSRMLGDFADEVLLADHNLVLEWKGDRIRAFQSPHDLGIQPDQSVDMLCYEQAVWDKVKGDRPNHRTPSTALPSAIDNNASANTGDKEEVAKVTLKLSGIDGEVKMRVPLTVTASRLLSKYARHKSLPSSQKLRLVFDGEALDGDAQMGSIGVEDDDMIEVERIS